MRFETHEDIAAALARIVALVRRRRARDREGAEVGQRLGYALDAMSRDGKEGAIASQRSTTVVRPWRTWRSGAQADGSVQFWKRD